MLEMLDVSCMIYIVGVGYMFNDKFGVNVFFLFEYFKCIDINKEFNLFGIYKIIVCVLGLFLFYNF